MLPVTTKFVNCGLLPSSSSEITSLKELLRIVTLADTLEKPSALPLPCPFVPTGPANQLFSSVTPEIGPLFGWKKMS